MKKREQNLEHDPETLNIPDAYIIEELNKNRANTYEETGLVSPSYPYGEEIYSPQPKSTPGVVIVIDI